MRCPGPLGSCSPVCQLGVLYCVCRVLSHLAPVTRCSRSMCCFAGAVSWATWLLFTVVPAPCATLLVRCVALLVPCRGPLGPCSPVCPLGVLLGWCCVLGHLAPDHRCASSVCCAAGAVSWATWLLFTGVPALCVVGRVRCPGQLGSCSPVCPLIVLCCVCGVLGLPAPVHRCARSVCCVACAVSRATWLLFTGVPARCVVLRVWCPGPLGSCTPVLLPGMLCCVCGVLCHLAPVHRCAHSVCCVACAVSSATWLLFTGVPARCVALLVRCPGQLGSCSPVCPLHALLCWCVSWATLLLITVVPAPCVALLVRCPGPLGSCSPVCPLGSCVACAVSWATWLLFAGVPAPCVAVRVRCPRRLGSCSPVCPHSVLCCVCGVLGHLAPVHRCARSVGCFACAMSWATWLLFAGVPA